MVRDRQNQDIEALVAALHDVHASDAYPSVWPQNPEAFLDPPDTWGAWVACKNGVPVGQVVLRLMHDPLPEWVLCTHLQAGQLAVVSRFFLIPGARGQGLAELLFGHAWRTAQALGRRAILDVHQKNTMAIKLYERLNWLCVAEVPVPWQVPGEHPATVFVYVAPE